MALDFVLDVKPLNKDSASDWAIRLENVALDIIDGYTMVEDHQHDAARRVAGQQRMVELFNDTMIQWWRTYIRKTIVRDNDIIKDPITIIKDAGYRMSLTINPSRVIVLVWREDKPSGPIIATAFDIN